MKEEAEAKALEYGKTHEVEVPGYAGKVFQVSASDAYMQGWADCENDLIPEKDDIIAEKNHIIEEQKKQIFILNRRLDTLQQAYDRLLMSDKPSEDKEEAES